MSVITTHVLDIARGLPASGIRVTLEIQGPDGAWNLVGKGLTDADGRALGLLPEGTSLDQGIYRLTFDNLPGDGLYPEITIAFHVSEQGRHYHIPLLLSPYGYTTYRGS